MLHQSDDLGSNLAQDDMFFFLTGLYESDVLFFFAFLNS